MLQLIHYRVVTESKSGRESEKPQPHEAGFRSLRFVETAVLSEPIASGNIAIELGTKSFGLKTFLTRDPTLDCRW